MGRKYTSVGWPVGPLPVARKLITPIPLMVTGQTGERANGSTQLMAFFLL
jgi:hypothetical protein